MSSETLFVDFEPREKWVPDYRLELNQSDGERRLSQKEGGLAPRFAAVKSALVGRSNTIRVFF